MKLSEFLKFSGMSVEDFAKKSLISKPTIRSIIQGYDTKLSTALQIEKFTNGIVKCSDIEPTKRRPYIKKSPSGQKEAPDHLGS